MGLGGTSVTKVMVKMQAPRLHYVYPICFEAGKPLEFVACGSNLLQSKFRYGIDSKEILNFVIYISFLRVIAVFVDAQFKVLGDVVMYSVHNEWYQLPNAQI